MPSDVAGVCGEEAGVDAGSGEVSGQAGDDPPGRAVRGPRRRRAPVQGVVVEQALGALEGRGLVRRERRDADRGRRVVNGGGVGEHEVAFRERGDEGIEAARIDERHVLVACERGRDGGSGARRESERDRDLDVGALGEPRERPLGGRGAGRPCRGGGVGLHDERLGAPRRAPGLDLEGREHAADLRGPGGHGDRGHVAAPHLVDDGGEPDGPGA
jgi:hypothetical protein